MRFKRVETAIQQGKMERRTNGFACVRPAILILAVQFACQARIPPKPRWRRDASPCVTGLQAFMIS